MLIKAIKRPCYKLNEYNFCFLLFKILGAIKNLIQIILLV